MSVLAVDVGSSRCKAALVAATGEILALRSAGYSPTHPRPGFAELDPDALLQGVTRLCREVSAAGAADPAEAVCFSSHGETLIPVGVDGRPLGMAILNTDGRAAQEASCCEERMGRRQLFAITGHVSHATYPVPKLMWLQAHDPERFAAMTHCFGPTDYLLFRLGLDPLIDYSHAARFMALDVRARAWSQEVLHTAGLSAGMLPVPVQAGTVAGRLKREAAELLGVSEGIPAVVGGHDQEIGAVGLGVLDAGSAAGSLGTYECLLVVSDEPTLGPEALRASLNSYPHVAPGKYVTIAYFPAGIMMAWLNELLFGEAEDAERWNTLEASAPSGPTGIVVTPHLIGSCNPEFDAAATAAIGGLTTGVTRAHLYKAALEGIASELALVAGCLESAGLRFGSIRVSGGGARSALGLQLRAALTGKQLRIARGEEAVCLGGAMLAAVALGQYANLHSAAAAMVHEKDCVSPDSRLREQYCGQTCEYQRVRSLFVHSRSQQTHLTGEQS